MSVNPGIIHSLIEKSVTVKYPNEIICHFQLPSFNHFLILQALSEELLESDLESVGELACSVLFDAIINWCEYADADNLEGNGFICILFLFYLFSIANRHKYIFSRPKFIS